MFVDPHSQAAQAEASLQSSDPASAALLQKISSQPAGIWFGSWIRGGRVAAAVRKVIREAASSGSVPLLVLYAFPQVGCGSRATAGAFPGAAYERWVGQVAAGIGTGRAAVIVEPDALAQYVAASRAAVPARAAPRGHRPTRQAAARRCLPRRRPFRLAAGRRDGRAAARCGRP
jgi:endoglucanase